MSDELQRIALFRKKEVRKLFHQGEWWFVLVDVVAVLTDSNDPAQYLRRQRERDAELNALFNPVEKGPVQIVPPLLLPVETSGGIQKLLCWHTEGIFRLIQSIPSKNAEPFKRWLAQVGYERVQEIENPELAMKRMKAIYRAKGYPEDWIEKRSRGIAVREELTDEWKKRGIKEGQEYSILTAEIAKAAFGITPSQHKKLKGIKRENLRDHMTDLELIFTMLGEASTTEIARSEDAKGFHQNKHAARRGGDVAGKARRQLEHETGQNVVSNNNYLPRSEKKQLPPNS